MREQITLDPVVATELAGSEDTVLKALEGHLSARVFLRGNVLTLDGSEDDVKVGREVVEELSDLIRQGHEISPGTIGAVTSALDQHESPATILGDVVWTHRSTRVAPKTVNRMGVAPPGPSRLHARGPRGVSDARELPGTRGGRALNPRYSEPGAGLSPGVRGGGRPGGRRVLPDRGRFRR